MTTDPNSFLTTSPNTTQPSITPPPPFSNPQTHYINLCLSLARLSPPKATNFCVGAVLVAEFPSGDSKILATGYTLECPGNTHAEQCCFLKFAASCGVGEAEIGRALDELVGRQGGKVVLYTSMEPCIERSSGNESCVARILSTRAGGAGGVEKVYTCVREPDTFVKANSGRRKLEEAGVEVVYVPGLEEESLEIARAGHVKEG